MTLTLALSAESETFVLTASRVAGVMVTAPMFSAQTIPALVRTALIAVLAAAVMPSLKLVAGGAPLVLGAGIVLQFLVGLLLGSVVTIVLSAFSVAGQAITYQLGVGLSAFANPAVVGASSVLAEWFTLLSLLVFVILRGPELVVVALVQSFQAIPLSATQIAPAAPAFVAGLFSSAITIALLVAAPMMVAGLVSDLTIGIVARAFPQINAFFMSLPVKFGLVLVVMLAAVPLFFAIVPNVLSRGYTDLSHLLVLLEGRP
jgi:flagellar biosynthetic protein FliR